MTENNALVSVLLVEQLKMEMMVPQRSKEATNASEVIPVLLPVAFPETQNHTEDRDIMDSTVELERTVIHQRQIPGRN